ncbi:MAG: hypothetical protein ACO289_11855 [Prochlorococcaceae cyanobacterium]
MGTSISAKQPQNQRHASAAPEQQSLAQVIRRNLAGSGDNPLDCLAATRESITELMAYLLDEYELPEPVALEFDAALAHVAVAEAHVRMAATRCC